MWEREWEREKMSSRQRQCLQSYSKLLKSRWQHKEDLRQIRRHRCLHKYISTWSMHIRISTTLHHCLVGLLRCVLHGIALEGHLETMTSPECDGTSSSGHSMMCSYYITAAWPVLAFSFFLGAIQSVSPLKP